MKDSSLDSFYHYPPELFELLVDAIPALCKSKQAVLDFFKGAGAPVVLLDDWHSQVLTNRDAVKKAEMARSVLRRLNEGGDSLLAQRREVVKRVSEFQDFSNCWENERGIAQLAVYKVREIVNVKDSFTRMSIERERERRERASANAKRMAVLQKQRSEREQIKIDLYALFGNTSRHRRGKALGRNAEPFVLELLHAGQRSIHCLRRRWRLTFLGQSRSIEIGVSAKACPLGRDWPSGRKDSRDVKTPVLGFLLFWAKHAASTLGGDRVPS